MLKLEAETLIRLETQKVSYRQWDIFMQILHY